MQKTKILIIGAGLTGLSCAYYLEKNKEYDYLMVEAENEVGGLCKTISVSGFNFDYTGHVLHLRYDWTRDLIKSLLKNNLVYRKRKAWIYSNGVFTRYPFQANLYGLPPKIISACLKDFFKARLKYSNNDPSLFSNFYDWSVATFGKGITRYFMEPYNRKIWSTNPRLLTTDWMGRFVPIPSIDEVVDGALIDVKKGYGYNPTFWYPKKGGIGALPQAISKRLTIKPVLNTSVVRVDINKKIVYLSNSGQIHFDILINTSSLKNFVKICFPIPDKIKKSADLLSYNSVLNLNLGFKGNVKDKSWVYFPEKKFIFYRVGFPSTFSRYNSPSGYSSIYAEASFIKNNINVRKVIEKMISDLIKIGFLKDRKEIVTKKVININCAYVIYDKNYKESRTLISDYLKTKGIFSVGRYGGWKYDSMEDAIIEGKFTADQIINGS